MILSGELPDLLLLLRKERSHIRCTLHMMRFSVGSDDRIKFFRTEFLQKLITFKCVFTSIGLPHTMIKTDAVLVPVRKKRRIPRAVLRIVHISAAIHLKPVYVGLFWQTKHALDGREHRHPLFQQVKAQLHLIIHHPMITDAALIHIRIAFIIGDIMPQ